ncbi:MAG: carboxyl-terminal processing protease [Arenicella sp.]|jgi:carboxyl-terminal processing protease
MKHLLIILTFVIAFVSFSQTTHIGKQAFAIDKMVANMHYDAKPLDDSLSNYIFEGYLESIDPSGFYFRQSDIDAIEMYRYEIDDQIKAKRSEFFDVTTRLYEKRLKTADSLITEVLKTPFDYTIDEEISYAEEDWIPYLLDTKSLQERWRKWLKYSTLEELFEGDYLEDAANSPIDSVLMFVGEARVRVEKAERFDISSFLKHPAGFRTYMSTFFLEVMAGYYDPHTSYFSDLVRSDFEEELSGDNFAYGFSLKEDGKGRIMLSSLVPGGSAWMSNQMSADDEILHIKFAEGRSVDVTLLDLDELQLIFDNEKSQSLVMKLKKANGKLEEVVLIKSEIYVDQDVIKSVILDGDKNVGYITLPDFYTNWDDAAGLGCANDVAKNIVKLKQENIDGLILDLRNNGGGSLKEAIDLAGIFINYGPITIEDNKYREPKSLKDMNKGAIYSGPLVILVNGLSASASEIFSAAMQDYNRAIIVGNTTYGKSTGQIILPLNPSDEVFELEGGSDRTFGNLKITTSKFYRITNETHQKEGVVPDVHIRDYYELYDYAEANYPNAISKDAIVKKMYYTPLAKIPSADLQSKSSARMNANPNYISMSNMIDTISVYTDYYDHVPLKIEAYKANEQKMNSLYDRLVADEVYESTNFEVTNNKFDAEIMKINEFRSRLNDEYLDDIQKDLYIGEAYNILTDYINSK